MRLIRRFKEGVRRPGDPAKLVAGATRTKSELGWQPQYAELETIIRHAWAWELHQVRHLLPANKHTPRLSK